MKKLLIAASSVFPAVVMAQGSTPTVDTSQAESAITAIQSGFTSIIDPLAAAVVAIVLAGVGIWVIPRIAGSLKSAFSSGKGR